MPLRNTKTRYGQVAIALHWFFVPIVFGLFALGLYMVELTYYDPWYRTAPHLHESVGLIALALLILRLGWAAFSGKPAPLPGHTPLERLAARLAHAGLYLLLLALMASGYFISTAKGQGIALFDWFTVPALPPLVSRQEEYAGAIHEIAAWLAVALATLHAAAALKHHFVDRDATLLRMLGASGDGNADTTPGRKS